jgi:uncharacterized membrane protein
MLDALQRLLLGLGVSGIVFLLLPTRVHLATRVIAAWDAFALVTLFLTWLIITGLQHHQVKRVCEQQDLSRRVISVVVVLAASVSLLAVGLLLGPVKGVRPEYANFHLILSIIAIAGSWLLLHTIFGMHYAHRYFLINRHRGQGTALHGLAFPGDAAPDYLDFEYFAFVIGMTFQVSDVEITARSLRRLVLMHSILSFAFNTLILALTVNVISSLV